MVCRLLFLLSIYEVLLWLLGHIMMIGWQHLQQPRLKNLWDCCLLVKNIKEARRAGFIPHHHNNSQVG